MLKGWILTVGNVCISPVEGHPTSNQMPQAGVIYTTHSLCLKHSSFWYLPGTCRFILFAAQKLLIREFDLISLTNLTFLL
jgi:hypothetical protein